MRPLGSGVGKDLQVVVLGSTGFIGSAVANELSKQPIKLRLVSRRVSNLADLNPVATVQALQLDLTKNEDSVAEAIDSADVVFPLVAHIRGASGWRVSGNDRQAFHTNVGIIQNLIKATESSRNFPTIVFPGSNTQHDHSSVSELHESLSLSRISVYDYQKGIAEQLLMSATEAGFLRATSLRLPPVYGVPLGPFASDRGIVTSMIRKALKDEPLTLWGEGAMRRNLLSLSDASRAFSAAAQNIDKLSGEHYCIGSRYSISIRELFEYISQAVASKTGRKAVPVVSVNPPPGIETSDLETVEVNPEKFCELTSWRAESKLIVEIERIIENFLVS